MGYWWRRLIEWVRLDRSLVTEADIAAPREQVEPERPGEEPPLLMSPLSLILVLVSMTCIYVGGSWFILEYEGAPSGALPYVRPSWGLYAAYFGLALFFYWCIRYPMRVLLHEEVQRAPHLLSERSIFSSRESLRRLKSRYGEQTESLGFARILFPSHEIRYAELFSNQQLLFIVPVKYEDFGHRTFALYRHDEVRVFPLADASLRRLSRAEFRRRHYWQRPRHHPEFTEDYFLLQLGREERTYEIVLKFRKREFDPAAVAIINASPPREGLPEEALPDPAGAADPLLEAWHAPSPTD